MLLKGSQRGTGQNLARHLLNVNDNEHIELHQLRGFASNNLPDAFKEVEAISRGTKCRQYLFSLSLSPPETANAHIEDYEQAIERIEEKLGLENQPRAIVFHEKNGRRHAHCVWSRIDAETMTAKHLPFFKQKLMQVSRDLYLEHGWKLPAGIAEKGARRADNFDLALWQQAKRNGLDPRDLKQDIQACWKGSDNLKSFERALRDSGFFLAKGDKRSFVVLDHNGAVYSLPRMLDLKTKEVKARLGDGQSLKSVDETKTRIGQIMKPAMKRHIDEAKQKYSARATKLEDRRADMAEKQRDQRAALKGQQRLQWHEGTKARAERLPTGWKALWWKVTGKYQHVRRENEMDALAIKARFSEERQQMIEKQREERASLQNEIKDLRKDQARLLWDLRRDIGRYAALSEGRSESQGQGHGSGRDSGLGLRLRE